RRCRRASRSPGPRCSGRSARWSASRKARSPTSTARSRTSTTTSRRFESPSRSSAARLRSSSTSRRSRRFEFSAEGGRDPAPSASMVRVAARGAAQIPSARRLNSKEGNSHGKESRRPHQAASAGRQGESVAADRSRARPARPQHHGVLQGVQRADPGHGAGPRASGRHHRVRRQVVHLRDEDAAGVGAHQEGAQAREGLVEAAPRQGRQAHARPGRGDRQGQAARPHRRRPRGGGPHRRRHRALDGHHRGRDRLTMATDNRQPKLTKRQKATAGKVESTKLYPIDNALAIVKECASAKFDESIDVAVQLGIDAKKSDQVVRGAVVMPSGTGKTKRVAVFAQGAKAEEARAAGADLVGMDDLAAEIKAGKMDFDVVIASPDTMRVVGTLGQILGPRGLMPNPKVGTVTPDVAQAVRNAKAGQVQFRVDKAGIVHATIGRRSFDDDKLVANLRALIEALNKAKPTSSKGIYLRKVAVSST